MGYIVIARMDDGKLTACVTGPSPDDVVLLSVFDTREEAEALIGACEKLEPGEEPMRDFQIVEITI